MPFFNAGISQMAKDTATVTIKCESETVPQAFEWYQFECP